jgi:uncharacterized protein (TIRG00374 family)
MGKPLRDQTGTSPVYLAPAMSAADRGGVKLAPARSACLLRWIARLLTSVILFAGALYTFDWRVALRSLADVDAGTFALALALVVAIFFLMGVRWFFLVRDIAPGGFRFHLRCYFTANFMNVFTPANLGGDAYRLLALRGHATGTADLVFALVRERFIGILAYAILYFAFLSWVAGVDRRGFNGGAMSFLLLAAALTIGLAFVWGIGRMSEIGRSWAVVGNYERATRVIDTLMIALRFNGVRQFAVFLGLSLAGGVIWTMVPLIVAHSLGTQVSFAILGMIVIFIELVRIVPITIQGIGVRESLFAYCFSLFDLAPKDGFLIGTVSYLALSLGLLALGIAGRLIPGALPLKSDHLA